MKRFRWALALLQGAMLVLAMCLATPAYADEVTVADETSLRNAITSATDNTPKTITLTDSIVLGSTLTIGANKNITLDLNGKMLTCDPTTNPKKRIEVAVNASLKITSTASDRSGEIVSSATIAPRPEPGKAPGKSMIRNQGTLTLEGNVEIESDDTCIFANNGTLNISNDTVKVTSKYSNAIASNGSSGDEFDSHSTCVNINGGIITSTNDVAVYIPAGTFNISGGTITGATGVYMKGGNLGITGGNITGNGAAAGYTYYGNGGIPTGDALVIDKCGYPYGKNDGQPAITVTNGSFKSSNAQPVNSYVGNGVQDSQKITKFISGGTYNKPLEENLLSNNCSTTGSGSVFTVGTKKKVAKVGETECESLKEAITTAATAGSGNTITLLEDFPLTQTVEIGNTVTLDLNGHTITCSSDPRKRIEVTTNGNLTITSASNGSIINSVPLPDSTEPGHEPGLAIIKNAGILTIGGNVHISSDDTCIYAAGRTLTINDSATIATVYGNAVATNGNDSSAQVDIKGGTMTSTKAVAVYAPSGTFNISGGTIIGATGVYMKGGTLNITGGNITGNGPHVNYTYYNNGGVPTGDALVIDSCNYPNGSNLNISVTGGSFSSTYGQPVSSHVGNNVAGESKETGFISGGTYNNDLMDKTLLAVGSGLVLSGEKYTVAHVHTFDYSTANPYWTLRRINEAWSATAHYVCTTCGETDDVPASSVFVTDSDSTKTIKATDKYSRDYTWTKDKNLSVTILNNAAESHWWGDVVTANNTTGTPWFVNTTLLGSAAKQFASSRTSFTFPVTENNTTISTTESGTGTEPFIYATLSNTNGEGKATFNVKWSLPSDAVVLSAIVYRGHTTGESAAVTMDNLIAKGSKRDTGLHVRVGDYTMNLTSLTPSNTQHIAIRIVYVTNGVENTLNCGVNVSGVESSYSGTPAQTNSNPESEP